jgi:hypothetical protein
VETQTVQPPQEQQQASLWEDFVDIFFSPGELFRRRANAGYGVAFVVLAVVCIILYYAFPTVNKAVAEAQIAASLAKNPERAAAMQARGGDPAATWWLGGIFVPIGMFLFIVVMALVTWLSAKIASVALSFKQSMTLNTWTGYVIIPQTILFSVLSLMKVNRGEAIDPIKDRAFGVLRFVNIDTTAGWMVGLLSRLDIFAVWQLLLTAIAVAAMAKTSKGNAYIVAGIVWLVGALPLMIAAAFM